MRKFADVVETVGKRWRQLESFGADFESPQKEPNVTLARK